MHAGTLKLLYEDIISKLRSEGRRELAFGFAPFFNVRDAVFPRIAYWIRWTNLYFYHYCNNLYAFQNLAFSKIRCAASESASIAALGRLDLLPCQARACWPSRLRAHGRTDTRLPFTRAHAASGTALA